MWVEWTGLLISLVPLRGPHQGTGPPVPGFFGRVPSSSIPACPSRMAQCAPMVKVYSARADGSAVSAGWLSARLWGMVTPPGLRGSAV